MSPANLNPVNPTRPRRAPEGQSIMPWRVEDELRALGANYIQAGAFRAFAVRDGNLVTGQQNFSGAETARLVLEAVGR